MTRAPELQTVEGRIAEMRRRGVPPAFWAPPLRRDPLLMVADRLIAPGARVLAWCSPQVRVRPPIDHTRELVLVDRQVVAADDEVVSFVFAHPRGAVLRAWRPGAHLDVVLPSGRMRQYSLCGDPDDPFHYRIAVRRITGGSGSLELHESVRVGARVEVRGPRNAFPLTLAGADRTGAARRIRFVAGGIGITPILGMMRAADLAGTDWSLIYTGRHRDSLPFLDEIAEYGDRVRIRTDDESGLPSGEDLVPHLDSNIAVYVCGPPLLLDVVAARVARAPGVELHCERFAPPPIRDGQPFTVQLGWGGRTLDIPADRSVLAVVAEADPSVPYSCRQGFCTTCKVRVLSGTVEHRDTVLNDAQRSQGDMLICVSRAEPGARLVLDMNTGAAAADRAPLPHRSVFVRYRARLARAAPKRMRLGGVRRVP
ncbi:PDR/VanB family oxidoreductase [Nocardia sp. NBC_01327]|uniref:PDR/VanB family oxidoreductase n=1 Tax=Nocardia sp. NBC_01327 TaxID=2903593 RepID=UPI002E0DF019|nr:PDR/VanB family oxidoreductase [Nocardia sp. NBC_01327]